MWFDPTKYHFVKFEDAEFFYPLAGSLIGGLWAFAVSTEGMGQFLRRYVRFCYWSRCAITVAAVALAAWLHSFGFLLTACLIPVLIRAQFLTPSLRQLPRLSARLSLRLYVEQFDDYDLQKMEVQFLIMSLFSFIMSAFWISPVFTATVLTLAIFCCVNAVLASLARWQLRQDAASAD
jgi:hypothetical protein